MAKTRRSLTGEKIGRRTRKLVRLLDFIERIPRAGTKWRECTGDVERAAMPAERCA